MGYVSTVGDLRLRHTTSEERLRHARAAMRHVCMRRKPHPFAERTAEPKLFRTYSPNHVLT